MKQTILTDHRGKEMKKGDDAHFFLMFDGVRHDLCMDDIRTCVANDGRIEGILAYFKVVPPRIESPREECEA